MTQFNHYRYHLFTNDFQHQHNYCLSWSISCCGGCPILCRMFYPLHSNIIIHQPSTVIQAIMSPDIVRCPSTRQNALTHTENHCFKNMKLENGLGHYNTLNIIFMEHISFYRNLLITGIKNTKHSMEHVGNVGGNHQWGLW